MSSTKALRPCGTGRHRAAPRARSGWVGGGAGPQTDFVAARLWRGALRLHDPTDIGSHSRLGAACPIILLTALVLWIVELTLAWAVITVPQAFDTTRAVGFDDRVVFAAHQVVGRGRNATELVARDGLPGVSRVDATVLRPLARSLHDLLGAVQNVGLDDFAMNHADVDHQRLSDVGIEPLSQAVQDPPSQEWMYAYVQFDGWDWKIVVDDDAEVDGG